MAIANYFTFTRRKSADGAPSGVTANFTLPPTGTPMAISILSDEKVSGMDVAEPSIQVTFFNELRNWMRSLCSLFSETLDRANRPPAVTIKAARVEAAKIEVEAPRVAVARIRDR